MNFDNAKEILAIHSGHSDNFDYINESSFVGVFCPYQGLEYEYFHEIIEVLFFLRSHLRQDLVDRDIISYIAEICDSANAQALRKDSSLQRNNLITDGDLEKLDCWVKIISKIYLYLLRKMDDSTIIFSYVEYLKNNEPGENFENIIPFLTQVLENINLKEDIDDLFSLILVVLEKFSHRSKDALLILSKLSTKKQYKQMSNRIKNVIKKISKHNNL